MAGRNEPRSYTGVLFYKSKQAFLVADPLEELDPLKKPEDAVWFLVDPEMTKICDIPEKLVRQHRLRVGDVLKYSPDTGEISPEFLPPLNRPVFNDLAQVTADYPIRPINLTHPATRGNPMLYQTLRALEAVSMIGWGQRLGVLATAEAGKTTMIEALISAFLANRDLLPPGERDQCTIMTLLAGERPEEITHLYHPGVETWAAPADMKDKFLMCQMAFLCMERAKRRLEQGHHVVLLIDSATRLGRLWDGQYGRTKFAKEHDNPGQGGMYQKAIDTLNRFFMSARVIEGGGSLTVIATALLHTGNAGDDRLANEIIGASNATITLQGGSSNARFRGNDLRTIGWPALHIGLTNTRKPEKMLREIEAVYSREGLTGREFFRLQREYSTMLKRIAGGGENGDTDERDALRRLLEDIEMIDDNLAMYRQAEKENTEARFYGLKDRLNDTIGQMVEIGNSGHIGGKPHVGGILRGILSGWYTKPDDLEAQANWLHEWAEELEARAENLRTGGGRKND